MTSVDFLETHATQLESDATQVVRTRDSDVTRVVHSSLIMRPIYELEARRFTTDGEGEQPDLRGLVDLMWVAFAILDSVSELTEYHMGVTRKEVLEKVTPAIENQVRAAGEAPLEGLPDLLQKVFDHLVNRDNRYLPFEYRYFDGASNTFKQRRFWLIKAVYTGKGQETLFSLTEEGYTAYFGLHETSALDSTAIGNLRIKLLIERGNVDDAIAVAEQNHKQCSRKAHDIRNTRRAIHRNIHAIDFDRINAMADLGAGQATRIQRESNRLHYMVLDNLQITKSPTQEFKLLQLARQLKRLNQRQMELVRELQHLPDDYHQNSYKLFRKRRMGILPPLEEVLKRVCRMEEGDAAAVGREFIAMFDPPVQPSLFDPGAIIDTISQALERRNATDDKGVALQEVDGESIAYYQSELTDALMEKAGKMVESRVRSSEGTLMEDLLKESLLNEESPLLPMAVALTVFQALLGHRIGHCTGFHVKLGGADKYFSIDLPGGRRYRGHQLVLTPEGKTETQPWKTSMRSAGSSI